MNLEFNTLINRLPSHIVRDMMDCPQDPIHHPEGNVYIHTNILFDKIKEVGRKTEINVDDLLIAAIFHDIGKINTTEIKLSKDGIERISHYGHEKESVKFWDKYNHLYKDFTADPDKVRYVILNHMRAHLYLDNKMTKQSKRNSFQMSPYFFETLMFAQTDTESKYV